MTPPLPLRLLWRMRIENMSDASIVFSSSAPQVNPQQKFWKCFSDGSTMMQRLSCTKPRNSNARLPRSA